MRFDPTKPVQTRDGRQVRILATDLAIPTAGGTDTIAALVTAHDGGQFVRTFRANGNYLWDTKESATDLINVPPKTREEVAYLNLGQSYSSLDGASSQFNDWPVLKVTFKVTEEDGLQKPVEVILTEVLDADA